MKTNVPKYVKYLDADLLNEKIKEYCFMPSGDIVVRLEQGESLWFDKNGKHPKSEIIFKEKK